MIWIWQNKVILLNKSSKPPNFQFLSFSLNFLSLSNSPSVHYARHCVRASVTHFSYILVAVVFRSGNMLLEIWKSKICTNLNRFGCPLKVIYASLPIMWNLILCWINVQCDIVTAGLHKNSRSILNSLWRNYSSGKHTKNASCNEKGCSCRDKISQPQSPETHMSWPSHSLLLSP